MAIVPFCGETKYKDSEAQCQHFFNNVRMISVTGGILMPSLDDLII